MINEKIEARAELYARLNELKATDYKITKTSEAIIKYWVAANGTEGLPYKDILSTISEREEIRDKINSIEMEKTE